MPGMPGGLSVQLPDSSWFVVLIDGTTTYNGVTAYTGTEQHLNGNGEWEPKPGGRILGDLNPGVPVMGALAEGDLALARPAFGAGAVIWELVPFPTRSVIGVKVCPVFSSGVVVGITVETTYSDGTSECVRDSSVCCAGETPPVTVVECCPDDPLPHTVCLDTSGLPTGACPVLADFAGMFALTWRQLTATQWGWASAETYTYLVTVENPKWIVECRAGNFWLIYKPRLNGTGSTYIGETANIRLTKTSCAPLTLSASTADPTNFLSELCPGQTFSVSVAETGCGGGGGGGISSTELGTASASGTNTATATLAGVSIPAGSELRVTVAGRGATALLSATVTYAGVNIGATAFTQSTPDTKVVMGIARYRATTPITGDVVMTVTGTGTCTALVAVTEVTGLAGTNDGNNSGSGTSSTPDAGSVATSNAVDYVAAGFALYDGGGPSSGTWAGGFAAGQDVSLNNVTLREGYRITSSTGTYHPTLTGTTPAQWAGVVVPSY